MVTVTAWVANRPLVTLPVIVATVAVEPLPVLAVSAMVDVLWFFHVIVAASLIVCLPVARPWHDELDASFSVALRTPAPPVLDATVQPDALAFAVAVCA